MMLLLFLWVWLTNLWLHLQSFSHFWGPHFRGLPPCITVGIWISWGKTKSKNSAKSKPFYNPAIQFSCIGNEWTRSDQSVNWHDPSLMCTIWSWWSKCQNTIRKVVFVVFPVQPESESTRNLLRKAVFIGHKAHFVKPKSLKWKVAEIQLLSRLKYWEKRGWAGFGVYQKAREIITKKIHSTSSS